MSSAGKSTPSRSSRAPRGNAASRSDRYGTTYHATGKGKAKSGDVTGKAMALVLVAVMVALLYYAFQFFSTREQVNAEISYVTHEVIDDETLRVWTDITRHDPNEAGYCIVQAYDYSKAEVGRREIPIPANGNGAMRVAVDIPTNARAVAGGVYGCSMEVPEFLDVENPDYVFVNDL